MPLYYAIAGPSKKAIKRKKAVYPQSLVTFNFRRAMVWLVQLRSRSCPAAALLELAVPDSLPRERRLELEHWSSGHQKPLKIRRRYWPTAEDYQLAATESFVVQGVVSHTDMRTGLLLPPPRVSIL
jgi:hypothetical protein